MKKKKFWKRSISGLLSFVIIVTSITWWNGNNVVEAASNAALTVDLAAENHEIVHGAAGFLYGISSEDVPTTNTTVPLKPKILATKGALGTEHPYGDALDVAKTFLESGGEQVQMYCSNYYGVFGVMADYKEYSEVLETIIAPAVVEWKAAWNEDHGTPENPKDNIGARIDIDKAIVYIPINEGTPIVGGPEEALALGYEDKGGWFGDIGRNEGFFIPWQSYYEAINRGDENAIIAGPNCWSYNGPVEYRPFIKWCYENDCLPDIATWHELDLEDLKDMSDHMIDFKQIWKDEVTDKGGPELPQIVINEYARMIDCGVPGRLVNWMARLEDEGIYGCLPFWHQANNLNDLAASANEGNGAWWLFKWYGDMSGKTLEVESNTSYEKLYGLASLDNNKQIATVLFGGTDGSTDVILKNVTETETFRGAQKVNISIDQTYMVGFHGALNEPLKILEGTYLVNADGSVTINMADMKFSDAYRVTITKAAEDSQITDSLVNAYHKAYEAENGNFSGGASSTSMWSLPGQYYLSGDFAVGMPKGATLTYTIDVPVDGKYRLDFVYGNGMGANAQNMASHAPYNINQSLSVDGQEAETVELQNTLMPAMTGLYTKYADLTAGSHTLTFTTLDAGTIYHDVAYVSYAGAINEEVKQFDGIYEAEQADFNAFMVVGKDGKPYQASTTVSTQTELSGYSGNGYVTGLSDQLLKEGGGVRWNVIVEKSGLYNISLRYQSSEDGRANIYIGNTTATLDNLMKSLPVSDTGSQWKTVAATVYLQKGINIIDVDADADIALDYMRVQEIPEEYLSGEALAKNTVIEAEDALAESAENVTVIDCNSASNKQYVKGLKGSADASEKPNQYLEFEFNAAQAGVYQMQVFQSNDDICGTHAYNIKIIDKYAVFEIRNEKGEITSTNRYFFINTFSAQTFREKTVPMEFSAGKNTVRVYNDDSWNVLYGGTQSTPGEEEMENYTPNFDKFVIQATALENVIEMPEEYGISIKTTAAGYATTDKNYVEKGGTFHLSMVADKGVNKIFVNGIDEANSVIDNGDGTYSLNITDVRDEVKVVIFFTEGSGEHIDKYIVNAGFGTGDTFGWEVEKAEVLKEAVNEYEGNFLKLSAGGSLEQEVTGVPEGSYLLYLFVKADSTAAFTVGTALLSVNGEETIIKAENDYTEISVPFDVGSDGILTINVSAGNLLLGALCLDNFSLQKSGSSSRASLYFVDAGDYGPTTVSKGDSFGKNNSVTDQIYGEDAKSGYKWGLLTFEGDQKINSTQPGNAVFTKYQQAAWHNGTEDGRDKNVSFRFACDQLENGINPRYVKYAFSLPAGKYEIEAGVSNGWGNAENPKLYTGVGIKSSNIDNDNLDLLDELDSVIPNGGHKTLSGTVEVDTDTEEFIVAILSNSPTIQLNYIIITEYEPTLEEIVVQKVPDKVEYCTGENLVLDGIEVVAKYEGGSKKTLDKSSLTVSGFNSNRATTRECTVTYTENGVTAEAKFDVNIFELLYFVDAGDHDPTTLSEGDSFGKYNSSVTDQIYDKDNESSYKWGLLTFDEDQQIDSPDANSRAVYTNHQRANLNSGAVDGLDKNESFRYAHDQDDAGITSRYVKYAFTMPAGTYKIEAGVGNEWGISGNPDLYTGVGISDSNADNDNLTQLASLEEAIPENKNRILSGMVTVEEATEEFVIAILTKDATINLNYIKVYALDSEKMVEKLVINQLPNKTRYAFGEAFEMDGLSATAYYDDGTIEAVTLTDDMLTGFNEEAAGKQTITVAYGGKTATFKVTVDKEVTDELVTFGVSKSRYTIGEEFDEATVVVNVVKTDGSFATLSSGYDINHDEFDKDTVGTYPIYVNYEDTEGTIYVRVIDDLVFSRITSTVSKKEYAIGTPFDPDSVVITAVYSNGTGSLQRRTLDAQEYTIDSSAYNTDKAGIYPIKVTYEEDGKQSTISFNVRVVDEKEQLKLMYFVDAGDHDPTTINKGDEYGESNSVTDQVFGEDPGTGKMWGLLDLLDPDGSKLKASGWTPNPISKAVYTQYTRAYSNSDYDCTDGLDKTRSFRYASGQDNSAEVKDKYDEMYVDYKFELEPDKQYKVEVYVSNSWGNSVPVSVYTNRGDETEKLISHVQNIGQEADALVTGYVTSDAEGYLTVNARKAIENGKSVLVNYIKIYEYGVHLQSVSVEQMPDKTIYALGDEFNPDGLKLAARYTDGSKEVFDIADLEPSTYEITGYDKDILGDQTLTISYTEEYEDDTAPITRKATFNVTVEAELVELASLLLVPPSKTVYGVGDELDLTGMSVRAVYTDESSKDLSSNDYKISGFNSETTGEKTVTVSYKENGKTVADSFKVSVVENVIVLTSITAQPLKTQFDLNEDLDLTGLQISASYDNGTDRILEDTEYTVDSSIYDKSQIGAYKVKISYTENGVTKEAEYEVKVNAVETGAKVLEKLVLIRPNKEEYQIEETLDLTGMLVMAEYTNKSQKILSEGEYHIDNSKFDSTKTGTYTIKITYEEDTISKDVTFDLIVKAKKVVAVETLIDAIGTVTYTDESKANIDKARTEFNKLSLVAQKLVTNYNVLTTAEAQYETLKNASSQQASADSVKTLIGAIGIVTYTDASKTKIDAARAAYNKLPQVGKDLVANYTVLTTAEARYEALKNASLQQAGADIVKKSINAIGTVTYTNASKAKINSARAAYNRLTAAEKNLVTNYKVLTAAETRYEVLKKNATSLEQGKTYTVGSYKYKVTSLSKKTVSVVGVTNKNLRTIRVANTVKIRGTTFKIAEVGKSAFKNCRQATQAVIGKNVVTIGNDAFYGSNKLNKITINSTALKGIGSRAFFNCSKLRNITIKSRVLNKVGSRALYGIHKNARIKVPAKNLTRYNSLFRNKGQSKTVKVVR